MNKELAAAQERVAKLELDEALAGFNPVAEARIGRSEPGVAGQSPANTLQIEKALRSVDAAKRVAEARERQNAPSHEEAIRILQAGQSPENYPMIRASATTFGTPAGSIPGPSQ